MKAACWHGRRAAQGARGPDRRAGRPLLERIRSGEIDPSFIITHRLSLDQVAEGYSAFSGKEDECLKVVMTP